MIKYALSECIFTGNLGFLLQILLFVKFIALNLNGMYSKNQSIVDLESNSYISQRVLLKHHLIFVFCLLDLFCQTFKCRK
jgi:hypothetical protein